MNRDRWRRIKEYVDVSLRLEPGERPGYLARVCGPDTELREEVESLITAYEKSGDLLVSPPQPDEIWDPMLGARIGSYKVVEHIGSGGMGSVYRALRVDEVFRKEVAIKVIRRGLNLEHVIRQFRRERQIMASLDHPNIAGLLDGGSTSDGLPYFVMEFIHGKPIDVYCNEKNLGVRGRLELFRTVCSAVDFAHRQGIVHRDIKPGNILVTREGVPKLLDFGIAKILNPEPGGTQVTVARAMTPEYASPEQLAGMAVSETSDVYSLGVLLCELLSGKRPYSLQTGLPLHATTQPSPQRPSRLAGRRELAGDLDNIVLMALRQEPERRYRSAGLMEDDIRRHLEGLPVRARKDNVTYRISKFLRRHRAPLMSAALAGAAACAVFLYLDRSKPPDEAGAQPRIVPLTSMPGREFQPYFSPDGNKIVYASSGESGENTDIFVQPVEHGPALRFTTDPADDESPVWSPDGARIAWLRNKPNEGTGVFVSAIGGGVHHRIAGIFSNERFEFVGRHLDWSPDGKWFAAADRNSQAEPFRIVLIGVKDGSKRDLTHPGAGVIGDRSPAFAPNGEEVAFIRAISSGVTDVYVARTDGSNLRRLTFDNRQVLSVTWGPDGRSIVFSSNRQGNNSLWRVPVSGGAPVRVPLVNENATEPAFSRDGRKMVYAQTFEDTNIWRIESSGHGTPKRLISSTQYDSSPQYSPDGTRVAFRSNRSGSNEIWICDSEGRNPVQVTHFDGPLTGTPRWSPDGGEIAFDSRPEGQAKIFAVAAAAGKQARQVTRGAGEDVVPSWSRDGRYVYFASNRSGSWQVWRVKSEGGGEDQVTKDGGFAAFESPDARYLYYAKGRTGPGLWRKRLPDGEEEPVMEWLKPGFWGYWAVVERGIYFADQHQSIGPAGLFFYPFRKPVKQLVVLEKPLRVADSAFAPSPDGRYLLYSLLDESGSDIMMIDHYR